MGCVGVFSEDELLPLSALQHMLFCERQCALIHIEQVWAENRLTVEGRHLHDRADHGRAESRGASRTVRGLAIRSLHLGLSGRADVVEFHAAAGTGDVPRVVPVEYKRGRPKSHQADEVQLCAQALCLEEMLSIRIDEGALFYATPRRRTEVTFDAELRALTECSATRLHLMIESGVTPRAKLEPKCESCSLRRLCVPEMFDSGRSARIHLDRELARSLATGAARENG